ncbi:PaaI family thioesterase [Colwellia sp. Bg11-28]|uniref:PaaI family thioesterase n=1 Tax=Colwellia sp. Bg11-28 TaxID=2058305 RepID=UPI000C33B096|nr:PaaI family thioesterase [Colwellia sp. Bg11-28]PKH87196.1 thioesterase [Colwellia sp. Bg11-28]
MISKEELTEFLHSEFPQTKCSIDEVGNRGAIVRHRVGQDELRPGGTVSGPVMMTTADVALYVAILGEIGLVPLAVTTSLTINFLRKPSPQKDIIGKCTLIKVGRILVVGEVELYSDGEAEPVAHVIGTYSIPPTKINND